MEQSPYVQSVEPWLIMIPSKYIHYLPLALLEMHTFNSVMLGTH